MKNIGFRFENTYAKLPDILVTKLVPVPVKKPKLIIFNNRLAKDLGLDVNSVTEDDLTNLFSGNKLPTGSEPHRCGRSEYDRSPGHGYLTGPCSRNCAHRPGESWVQSTFQYHAL